MCAYRLIPRLPIGSARSSPPLALGLAASRHLRAGRCVCHQPTDLMVHAHRHALTRLGAHHLRYRSSLAAPRPSSLGTRTCRSPTAGRSHLRGVRAACVSTGPLCSAQRSPWLPGRAPLLLGALPLWSALPIHLGSATRCTPTFQIGRPLPRLGWHVRSCGRGRVPAAPTAGECPQSDGPCRRARARAVGMGVPLTRRAWRARARLMCFPYVPACAHVCSPLVAASARAAATPASSAGAASLPMGGCSGALSSLSPSAAPHGAALCPPPSNCMGAAGWISMYVDGEGGEGGGPLASCVGHEGERDGGSYVPQVARCASQFGGLSCLSLQSPSVQPVFLLSK